MSEAAPPPVPAFRYTTCSTCTREVIVDFYHEGPAQCEYCSGKEVGFHERMKRERQKQERKGARHRRQA